MQPVETFCDGVRVLIGRDLSEAGLRHDGDWRFRKDERDDHSVCLYRGNGYSVAIAWSLDDGVFCTLTADPNANVSDYAGWQNLWAALGMFDPDDSEEVLWAKLDATIDSFPTGHDEMLRFTAAKLKEFFEGD